MVSSQPGVVESVYPFQWYTKSQLDFQVKEGFTGVKPIVTYSLGHIDKLKGVSLPAKKQQFDKLNRTSTSNWVQFFTPPPAIYVSHIGTY